MGIEQWLNPESLAHLGKSSGIAAIVGSRWGWPIAEVIHFVGITLLFGTVGMIDLRMLGVGRGVSLRALHRWIPLGVAGFVMTASSGLCFVLTTPAQYLYNPALQTKLLFVGAAGINMLAFYFFCRREISLTPVTGMPSVSARGFALVSLLCWTGAIVCGRVVTAFRPPFHWCAWC